MPLEMSMARSKQKVGWIVTACVCLIVVSVILPRQQIREVSTEQMEIQNIPNMKAENPNDENSLNMKSENDEKSLNMKSENDVNNLNMKAENDEESNEENVEPVTPKTRNSTISLPPGTQMAKEQVAAILKVLPKAGNLLVWGLGNDSPFWHEKTKGKVIFIEPKGLWYDKIKHKFPYLEAYTVKYTTDIEDSFDKYKNNSDIWSDLDLRAELPPVVNKTPWDVIIVDAPTGYKKGTPGRYQSIYTSSLIAHNGTHIFVDDFERKVERVFSLKMLGNPVEVIERKPHSNAPANKQAHFIHIKSKNK